MYLISVNKQIIENRDDTFSNKNRFMNSILQNSHLDEFVSTSEMQNKTHTVIRASDAELRIVEPTSVLNIQRMK